MSCCVADKAYQLRKACLEMTTKAGSGHPTSCLSAADLFAVLFFHTMRFKENDQFVLSKGHAAPLLYAAWWQKGQLSYDDLLTLRSFGSPLEGHPTPRFPLVDVATGSLGCGLSIGLGKALAAKKTDRASRVYVLMGDSECTEGSVWEAVQLAAYYAMDNLVAIIDVNALGQRGTTLYGHDMQKLQEQWHAFGWQTFQVDGHDIPALINMFDRIATSAEKKPKVLFARTHKGHGVSFLQDASGWHGKSLDSEQLQQALQELDQGSVPALYCKKEEHVVKNTLVSHRFDKKPNDNLVSVPHLPDVISVRKALGLMLVELAQDYKNILVFDAEVSNSTYTDFFAQAFPDRFVQSFIAEQNMVGMAIGASTQGFIAVCATFGAFLTRACDQLRMAAIGRNSLILIGTHVGVSVGQDGPSQMALEDMALFCSLPHSVVLSPADGISAAALLGQMVEQPGSIVYIRVLREETPLLYGPNAVFTAGGCHVWGERSDAQVVILATGITVHEALKAQEALQVLGVIAVVIDVYSIKPLDKETIGKTLVQVGNKVVIVEDHYKYGGLGQAILLAFSHVCLTVKHLCVTEIPGSGSPCELRAWANIDALAIIQAVQKLV